MSSRSKLSPHTPHPTPFSPTLSQFLEKVTEKNQIFFAQVRKIVLYW
ncbi:MAG: hypothetical protein O9295_06545 [Microcystis sp. LE18-22.4A]|nr:hypothetical protein [Microcystis sp. LE18-22.4A]ODV38985.1 hypothetical protein BFG60_1616 [Microcystis aeruginosa NIES-98]